ncbi:MAG: hypothetical protein RL036_551 [Actinomycetota bacterium]|jgi:hypothetical protein
MVQNGSGDSLGRSFYLWSWLVHVQVLPVLHLHDREANLLPNVQHFHTQSMVIAVDPRRLLLPAIG